MRHSQEEVQVREMERQLSQDSKRSVYEEIDVDVSQELLEVVRDNGLFWTKDNR